jgi:hypothetical protein
MTRKLANRINHRYRKIQRFKSIDENQIYKYRDFFIASPSSAIAEAYCLHFLSKIPTLQNSNNVYSYKWPDKHCDGNCFSYFYSGYKDRRERVTNILRTNKRSIVLVYDLKNFYPSINKDIIRNRLDKHIKYVNDVNIKKFIINTIDNVLKITENGIPIGPAIGHVFGNLALQEIDKKMSDLYGNKYYRYVDDIFIVCDKTNIKKVHNELSEAIEKEQLSLNTEKTDEVNADTWLNSIPTHYDESLSSDYEMLMQRIKLFLWKKPEDFEKLQKIFFENGISIPLNRFLVDSNYGRFHRFFKHVCRTTNWNLPIAHYMWTDNCKKLFDSVIKLRKQFFLAVKNLRKIDIEKTGMSRRWKIQRIRYLLNRLIYLISIDEIKILLQYSTNIHEFEEFNILINSLHEIKIDNLIKLAGPTVSTFGSICQQRNISNIPYNYNTIPKESYAIDSIAVLATYGIVEPPLDWINSLNKKDSEFIKFCAKQIPEKRIITDLSFEDEIRSLQIGLTHDDFDRILKTRFSDREALNFNGLLLSKYGSG